MAARKLAAEIDKTLKKIAEGVLEFEGIHEKLHSASTPSQSAKYESELKTSIKRLQRHRDSLKTWLQNGDIKDKSALLENRKLIEVQMERFKASEKEIKTKAFSKEGLIAASRLDPAEKAKVELSQWLSGMVDELGRQVETTEAEIEQLAGGAKKKKGATTSERAAQLDQMNDRRKWHSSRLEILLRMLENGTLETDRVSDIKEDISYFVESNADEDFEEDEGIYDEFNLDEEEEAFGLKDNDDMNSHDAISIPDDAPTPTKVTVKEAPKGRRESDDIKSDDKTSKKGPSTIGMANTTPRKASNSEVSAKAIPPVNFAQAKATTSQSPTSTIQVTSPPKVPATASLPPIRYAAAAAAAVSPGQISTTAPSTTAASAPSPVPANDAIVSSENGMRSAPSPPATSSSRGETNGAASCLSPAPSHAQSQSIFSNSIASTPAIEHAKVDQEQHDLHVDDTQQQSSIVPVSPLTTTNNASTTVSGPPGLPSNGTASVSSPQGSNEASLLRQGSIYVSQSSPSLSSAIAAPGSSMPDSNNGNVQNNNHTSLTTDGGETFQPAQLAASSAAAGVVQPAGGGAGTTSQQAAAQRQQGTEARLPSSLADLVSSFESAKQNSMRRDHDLRQVHSSLESSFMNVPEPQDSDKPRYYVPQNPFPTPHWYPQSTSNLFDNPIIYAKFDEDTLFYIFYYSQRDYHRYLAAKELKRQSWRFSIRYGTWFRRHSEPIVINEEYEEGSYVYFDFESSWCQRRKNHFRFEYKYLESEL